MTAIDPHKFKPALYVGTCATCGLDQRMCELTYKPREEQVTELGLQIEPHDFRGAEALCSHVYSDGTKCDMSLWQHESKELNVTVSRHGVCDHFTGRREWGIGPAEPWRTCITCGWPKAQHALPSCPAVLNIAGANYACELNHPHEGWAHSNKEAKAIWTGNDIEGRLRAEELKRAKQ